MKNLLQKTLIIFGFLASFGSGILISNLVIIPNLEPKETIVIKKVPVEKETIRYIEIEKPIHISGIIINKFINPVSDNYIKNISSEQGLRNEIALNNGGTAGKYYHNAVDIAMPEGTRINATKDGIVTNVYPSYYNGGGKYKGHPTYGGLVEIQHDDGTKTLYAHLSLTLVREGEKVISGQKIGESGGIPGKRGSGISTGPHLHYSIILDMNTFTD